MSDHFLPVGSARSSGFSANRSGKNPMLSEWSATTRKSSGRESFAFCPARGRHLLAACEAVAILDAEAVAECAGVHRHGRVQVRVAEVHPRRVRGADGFRRRCGVSGRRSSGLLWFFASASSDDRRCSQSQDHGSSESRTLHDDLHDLRDYGCRLERRTGRISGNTPPRQPTRYQRNIAPTAGPLKFRSTIGPSDLRS